MYHPPSILFISIYHEAMTDPVTDSEGYELIGDKLLRSENWES